MAQEKTLKPGLSKDVPVVKKVKIKKNLEDYRKSHPYGFGRYENIAKHTFYIHTEAFRTIAGLCRRSNIAKYQWPRIETAFLNSYGLSKLPNGIIVQEEIVTDPTTGSLVKGGPSELLQDFLDCLDEELNENENKVIKLVIKWEKIAQDLQKEFKSKAKVGNEYDNSGRKRIEEDITEKPIEWKG